MSVNDRMHSRSIYRNPMNYTDLAIQFPEFRDVCTHLNLDGTVAFDLKCRKTLETLNLCLLKRDFDLEIEIPDNRLVPTIPLRLNYILWIEDLFNTLTIDSPKGIDIGCGATCIYALLAAKKNGWKMLCLETNYKSTEVAGKNVQRNDLTKLIEIFHQTNREVIFQPYFVKNPNETYDFCMCNPPFYDIVDKKEDTDCIAEAESESPKKRRNRTGRRPPAKNAATGCDDELYYEGGELAFVQKIYEESKIFKERIRIYTTMLGAKQSAEKFFKLLKTDQVTFLGTRFCQGNVTRWGVAWSFDSKCKVSLALDVS